MNTETLTAWISKIGTAPDPPARAALRCGAIARFFGASREQSSYRHIPALQTYWLRGYDAMHSFLSEGGVLACPFCLQPWSLRVFPASSAGENLTDWLRRTKSPSADRFDASVHRLGAFTRLAGGARATTYRFHDEIWLAAYDAMDRYLTQGGTLRCPCCDRPWYVPEGFSFPPNSEWRPAARMLRATASEGPKTEVEPPAAARITLLPVQGQISLNRSAARVLNVDEHAADLLLEWFRPRNILRIRRADGPLELPFEGLKADSISVRPVTLYQRRSTRAYIIGGLGPFFRASKGLIWGWRAARRFAPVTTPDDALLLDRSGAHVQVGRRSARHR